MPGKRTLAVAVAALLTLLVFTEVAHAQEPSGVLKVGTKEAPPFSLRDADGRWTGIAIELFREIAGELGKTVRFEERTLENLLEGVRDGTLDAAVGALTVTAEREKTVDFTHPFFTTGLGIAVPRRHESGWQSVLSRVLSPAFLKVLGFMVLLLLASGFLIWLFERRRNHEQFGGDPARGIANGFWWSAVTMTTVGYGDKAPRSVGGRLVAIFWMFTCVILISGLTAAIASALTVSRLEGSVAGPEDLPAVRVATLAGTTSESYLRGRRIGARPYPGVLEALQALSAGDVEAVVHDAPILRWIARERPDLGIEVLPLEFQIQNYAIALPQGGGLREPLNRLLLQKISEVWWRDLVFRYLGR
jgi:ABC-type amino acid transport substrate-binding protein